MDQITFTNLNEPWWLLEQDLVPPTLRDLRDQLADDLGWDRFSWYTDPNLVVELWNRIQMNQPRLADELDEATDETRQELWLTALRELLAPAGAEETAAHEAAETEAEQAGGTDEGEPGVWDDNWGMLYRVGPDGSYQYAFSDDRITVRPGTPWMSEEEATQAKGADASHPASAPAEVSGEAEPATAAQAQTEPQQVYSWSQDYGPDGQGMFYRQGNDGAYEFAFSSTGDDKGQPVEPWIADPKRAVEATANLQLIVDSPIDVDQETAARLASDPTFAEELQQVPAGEDLAAWAEEVEVDWTELDEEAEAAGL